MGELLHLIGRYGYLTVFSGVMLESAGVPLPGETVLIAAGALVHKGVLDFRAVFEENGPLVETRRVLSLLY